MENLFKRADREEENETARWITFTAQNAIRPRNKIVKSRLQEETASNVFRFKF